MENEQQPKIVNHNEMRDCNVFMGDSYGGIFPLPGSQVTVTQNLGPQKKSTSVSGDVETKEQRFFTRDDIRVAIKQYFVPSAVKALVLFTNDGRSIARHVVDEIAGAP